MHNFKFGPNLFIESDNNNSSIIPISTTTSTYYNKDGSIRKRRIRGGKTKLSVVNRPIRHLGTICLCYSDPKDCTTCSARVMSFDEITIETHSCISSFNHISPATFVDYSFRKTAGSCSSSYSSSDGSSLFDNDFLIGKQDENDNFLSYFETKTSQTEEIDELLRHLKDKIEEVKEFVRSCSNTFAQVKLMNRGYQKEISEMMRDLQHRTENILSEDQDFFGIESISIFQDSCEKSYQMVRNVHMERMMDEDLMRSNVLRMEELRSPPPILCPPSIEISDNLDVLEKEIEHFLKSREENEPLTDDCLTCMSFDPGQILGEN